MKKWFPMENRENTICAGCVGNKILHREIENGGSKGECHFCKRSHFPTISLLSLADRIEPVLRSHFSPINSRLEGNEWLSEIDEYEFYYDFDSQSPQEIIEEVVGLSNAASKNILQILSGRHPGVKPGDIDDSINIFSSETRLEENYSVKYMQDWGENRKRTSSQVAIF